MASVPPERLSRSTPNERTLHMNNSKTEALTPHSSQLIFIDQPPQRRG
jgi:hypothetical protein